MPDLPCAGETLINDGAGRAHPPEETALEGGVLRTLMQVCRVLSLLPTKSRMIQKLRGPVCGVVKFPLKGPLARA